LQGPFGSEEGRIGFIHEMCAIMATTFCFQGGSVFSKGLPMEGMLCVVSGELVIPAIVASSPDKRLFVHVLRCSAFFFVKRPCIAALQEFFEQVTLQSYHYYWGNWESAQPSQLALALQSCTSVEDPPFSGEGFFLINSQNICLPEPPSSTPT